MKKCVRIIKKGFVTGEASKTAKEIAKKTGRKVIAIQTDCTPKEQVDHMVKQIVKELGDPDFCYNNAGIDLCVSCRRYQQFCNRCRFYSGWCVYLLLKVFCFIRPVYYNCNNGKRCAVMVYWFFTLSKTLFYERLSYGYNYFTGEIS